MGGLDGDVDGLGPLVEVLRADLEAVARKHRLSLSEARIALTRRVLDEWRETVRGLPFEGASTAVRVDHALIVNRLDKLEIEAARAEREREKMDALLPFGRGIVELDREREAMVRPDPQAASRAFAEVADQIEAASVGSVPSPKATAWAKELDEALGRWAAFHTGYDPELDWWVRQPLQRAKSAMKAFLARPTETGSEIPGDPVGRDVLLEDLRLAFLDETPEELIAIGEREYAWCLAEMKKASSELGFGEDWKAALEHVKDTAVPPGEQPWMVRDLALEAIEWVESRDLLTVPALAKETWQMRMMTAEEQKVSPFFLGGETIWVSYPTDGMTPEEKRMSMRGNNPNFSRATVQHELVPGHHMQSYFTDRYRRYRRLFWTPFWVEGWTIYWELLLWEMGFPRTPAERIGMLFWRMHRCVRISFSLRFHLGQMSAAECVDVLVDQVGHERANAEGEVRRSFGGLYPPLYQLAYMIGGLKFWEIQQALVPSRMGLKEFHDRILRENHLPPRLLRLALEG